MVKDIQSDIEFQNELKALNLIVVDFYALWCGPCRNIAPIFEQLSSKYPMVTFLKVNVDSCPNIAATYSVKAMPTFLFIKNNQVIDNLKVADPNTLEQKILTHKVDLNPFNSSKGYSLGAKDSDIPPPQSSREARLRMFGHIDKKMPNDNNMSIDNEELAMNEAIALSLNSTTQSNEISETTNMEVTDSIDASNNIVQAEYDAAPEINPPDEQGLVPIPVNVSLLTQLIDMGFAEIHGRKAIVHGQTLEGALEWLEAHADDKDLDAPYLVRQEDANKYDENGIKKQLSPEERQQKVKELEEKAKKMRAEKEKKAKEDEIKKEKERRERGQNLEKISEERERNLRQIEFAKQKKEKEDAKREKERILAEIARDKELRKQNSGKLPSALGVDGYNPSSIQYNIDNASTKSVATKPIKASEAAASIPMDQKIDVAIQLICKHRTGGDGGNALKLLITFVKNIVENSDEIKYRSINMESSAFKSKLANITGSLNLLLCLGFVKDESDAKLKYEGEVTTLMKSTLNKLTQAEITYRSQNL